MRIVLITLSAALAFQVSMLPVMNQVAIGTESLVLTDVGRRLKAIFIGSIGNLVEWYDFYAYTAFALYFADSFFPGSDPVVQQLNAAIVFAIGFVMRPIGGWLFGHLADHHGRRNALMLSVLLMCFGSLVIAVHADLCLDRSSGTSDAGPGADRPGLEPRRRVRRQRDLSH